MRYIELPEKMEIFMNLILDYKILTTVIISLLLLLVLFVNKKISKKKYLIVTTIIFLIALVITILTNSNELLTTFDNIINNVFKDIYFPSVEVYLFILLVSIIVTSNSILNKKIKSSYKIINILMFFTLFFLLLSFLLTIANKDVDIFNKSSIYTNENCIVLLQLSTQVFIIWIIISLIIYIINVIMDRTDKKIQPLEITNNIIKPSYDDLIEVIVENDEEKIVYEQEDFITEIGSDLVIENPIIENVSVVRDKTKFTLNDYKIFSCMLKDTIILNKNKNKITKQDMLNINVLEGLYSKEEFEIYKMMLNAYID